MSNEKRREMRFRAFGLETKTMFHWSLNDAQSGWVVPDQKTSPVMQFTGLKDSTGADIFEGDILNGGWVVKIGEFYTYLSSPDVGKYYITGVHIEKDGEYALPLENGRWTVIGNIHSNPELLNQNG